MQTSLSAAEVQPASTPSSDNNTVDLNLTEVDPGGASFVDVDKETPSSSPMVVLLDPQSIDVDTEPNRLSETFDSASFEALVDSILKTRGNTIPIVVRVLQTNERVPESAIQYRLISGARRLKACALAQLPVRAIVQITPTTSHAAIDRLIENHLRQALSPFELGMQLLHIQQLQSPPSKRALARLIGMDEGQVLKAMDIAQLPSQVIEAFASPSDVRYPDAKLLKDAFRAAPEAVLHAAELVRKEEELKAVEVVKRLCQAAADATPDGGVESFNTPKNGVPEAPVVVDGQTLGKVGQDKKGNPFITLNVPLSAVQQAALSKHIEAFIRRRVLRSPAAKKWTGATDARETAGADESGTDAQPASKARAKAHGAHAGGSVQ